MARRKSGFTELLKIASALPWKVSAGWVPIFSSTDVAGMGPVIIRAAIHTFASVAVVRELYGVMAAERGQKGAGWIAAGRTVCGAETGGFDVGNWRYYA